MPQHIERNHSLNTGREIINRYAIDPATRAEENSLVAKDTANTAGNQALSANLTAIEVKNTLKNIVLEAGASDAEVISSRGNYDYLPDRLNENFTVLSDVQKTYRENVDAAFCFIDDDGKSGVFSDLKAIFDARNAKFSTAIITGSVGKSGYMTADQIKQLSAEGFEIISHTVNHVYLAEMDIGMADKELADSKIYLESLGLRVDNLAIPFGSYNDEVLKRIRKYYQSAVNSERAILNERPLKHFKIGRVGIGTATTWTLAQIKERIDYCIRNKLLCVFMTHIDETPAENRHLIGDTIDYIQSKGYSVTTYRDAFLKHRNRIDYGDYSLSESTPNYFVADAEGKVEFSAGKTTIFASGTHVFATPITDYPKNMISAEFIRNSESGAFPEGPGQGGMLLTYRVTNDDAGNYQMFVAYSTQIQYIRKWQNGAWGQFISAGSFKVANVGEISASMPATNFPIKAVTSVFIRLQDAAGFPESTYGNLVTYTLARDYVGTYQEYTIFTNKNRYIRNWQNGEWGEWTRDTESLISKDKVELFNKAHSEYASGKITVEKVFADTSSGFPSRGGTLLTNNMIGEAAFCYQEYHPVRSTLVYKRYVNMDGTWSAFSQV